MSRSTQLLPFSFFPQCIQTRSAIINLQFELLLWRICCQESQTLALDSLFAVCRFSCSMQLLLSLLYFFSFQSHPWTRWSALFRAASNKFCHKELVSGVQLQVPQLTSVKEANKISWKRWGQEAAACVIFLGRVQSWCWLSSQLLLKRVQRHIQSSSVKRRIGHCGRRWWQEVCSVISVCKIECSPSASPWMV